MTITQKIIIHNNNKEPIPFYYPQDLTKELGLILRHVEENLSYQKPLVKFNLISFLWKHEQSYSKNPTLNSSIQQIQGLIKTHDFYYYLINSWYEAFFYEQEEEKDPYNHLFQGNHIIYALRIIRELLTNYNEESSIIVQYIIQWKKNGKHPIIENLVKDSLVKKNDYKEIQELLSLYTHHDVLLGDDEEIIDQKEYKNNNNKLSPLDTIKLKLWDDYSLKFKPLLATIRQIISVSDSFQLII